jgi:ribulose-5-phosphate 4-epimerase/fuculose-1-phosphate aldolase
MFESAPLMTVEGCSIVDTDPDEARSADELAINPRKSGATGLFSSASGAVSVSSGGAEMMRVNATGVELESLTFSERKQS